MAASFSNITTVTSQPSTRSAGEANSFAPASTRAFVFAELRFQTPTSCPTDINRCAIADPIRPVPHTPIFIVDLNLRVDGWFSGHERRRDSEQSALHCSESVSY